jgi:argininosuccinate synthase
MLSKLGHDFNTIYYEVSVMKQKVVLAYSGGLDTSVILTWLVKSNYDVVAFIANVGQDDDLEAARNKAIKCGASEVFIEDIREEFVSEYIFTALRADARYEGRYLLGTSLARPVIAKRQIEIARKVGAQYVSHGSTGKGNDQVRFELAYYALMPGIKVIAPWKDSEFLAKFKGRPDLLAYAKENNIPIDFSTNKAPYSMDGNLMHISYEGGMLEDPAVKPPTDMFRLTRNLEDTPDTPSAIEIAFEQGNPVKVFDIDNARTYKEPLAIMEFLNSVGGMHGVGRIDIVENRYVGVKSRGVYESPGATILWQAHQDLSSLTLDREVLRLQTMLSSRMADVIYNGYWFSPEMEFLRNAIDFAQKRVTGIVNVSLFKGRVYINGRSSEFSLYNPDLSSMDKEGGYDQRDAGGFIRINSVRLVAWQNSKS